MDLEHELQTQAQKVAEEYERERLAAEAEDAAHRLAQRANQQKARAPPRLALRWPGLLAPLSRSDAAAATVARAQIIQTTVAQVVGLYAVSQACMLTVFVPQKCPKRMPGSSLLFTYKTELPEGHLCTLQEVLDFSTRTLFGNVVYGFNVGTLVLMLAAQVYFWKREVWFIRHLQDDESAPYSNLATLLKRCAAVAVASVLPARAGPRLSARTARSQLPGHRNRRHFLQQRRLRIRGARAVTRCAAAVCARPTCSCSPAAWPPRARRLARAGGGDAQRVR